MHFISGGAYNGKANWVKNHYSLGVLEKTDYLWLSAYKKDLLAEDLTAIPQKVLVLEGLERWVYTLIEKHRIDDVRKYFQKIIQDWITWASKDGNKLVIIGVDMSKGVVPIDANLRNWRDVTGFIYQDIVKQCSVFHYVWYGIAKQLK